MLLALSRANNNKYQLNQRCAHCPLLIPSSFESGLCRGEGLGLRLSCCARWKGTLGSFLQAAMGLSHLVVEREEWMSLEQGWGAEVALLCRWEALGQTDRHLWGITIQAGGSLYSPERNFTSKDGYYNRIGNSLCTGGKSPT